MPTFLEFQAMFERLLDSKIKSVQTDWGGEITTSIPFFNPLASSISFHVLTRINNKDALNENTIILLTPHWLF